MNLDHHLCHKEKKDGHGEQEVQSWGRQGRGDDYTHSFEGKIVE